MMGLCPCDIQVRRAIFACNPNRYGVPGVHPRIYYLVLLSIAARVAE